MRGRAQHVVQRAQPLCHEQCNVLKALAAHHQRKVVPSAHQHHAVHLVKAGDVGRNLVKAAVPLGRNAQLDDGLHPVGSGLVPVDQRLIAVDDVGLLVRVDLLRHFLGRALHHRGDILKADTGVFLQDLEYLFHGCSPLSSLYISPLHL